jgi:hypothetical protein
MSCSPLSAFEPHSMNACQKGNDTATSACVCQRAAVQLRLLTWKGGSQPPLRIMTQNGHSLLLSSSADICCCPLVDGISSAWPAAALSMGRTLADGQCTLNATQCVGCRYTGYPSIHMFSQLQTC